MKTKLPLTGRGKAMLVAAPALFTVSEAVFHANPIVGTAIGVLAGIVAYRHWDDADAAIETLKAGTITDYEPREGGKPPRGHEGQQDRRRQSRGESAPRDQKNGTLAIDIPIAIGVTSNGKTFARPLRSMKNIIILGLPGGGKTNTAIHILKHCVRNGCRLAIIDKHARAADDSLSAKIAPWKKAFICPVAGDPDSALSVVESVRDVMDERLDGVKPDYPLILVVDEYSAIMRQREDGGKWQEAGEELAGLMEDIVTEGRKTQIYVICIGQITNVSRTGGSEIRELFPTRIAHGMSPKQAGLFGFTEQKNLLPGLGSGEIFIQAEAMAEPIHLKVRYETEEDIEGAVSRIPTYVPATRDLGDDEETERDTEELPDDDQSEERPVARKQLPPLRQRKSKEQEEEDEELDRAIDAYLEGATTIDALGVAMGYKTQTPARKMMARVKAEIKKREAAEAAIN